MKQYRTCEIDGCDKLARPYRYSTCWKHSAYGSLKEARRTKQKHRQMQAVPKIEPDPSEWIAAHKFCKRNCDPVSVGHHFRCAWWLWEASGTLKSLNNRNTRETQET